MAEQGRKPPGMGAAAPRLSGTMALCFDREGASLSSRGPGQLLAGKQEARRARRWQLGSHPASALRSCLVLPWACARGALTHDAPGGTAPFCDTGPRVRIAGTIGTPERCSRQSHCPVRRARCRRTSTTGLSHICNPKGAAHTEAERRTEKCWSKGPKCQRSGVSSGEPSSSTANTVTVTCYTVGIC